MPRTRSYFSVLLCFLIGMSPLHAFSGTAGFNSLSRIVQNTANMAYLKRFAADATLLSQQGLRNQFSLLENVRRLTYTAPSFILSQEGKMVTNSLHQLYKIDFPAWPDLHASTAVKEQYLQQVNTSLFERSSALAEITHQNPRPLTPAHMFKNNPKKAVLDQTRSSAVWEYVEGYRDSFSWGIPHWNEVKLAPYTEFSDRANEALQNLVQSEENITAEELFSAILNEPMLTSLEKQTMIRLIAESSTTMDFYQVYTYLENFGYIPVVSSPLVSLDFSAQSARTFAVATQNDLLSKFIAHNSWTEAEFDLFSDVSAFLEPDLVKAELAALTYLEPRAARWLLNNGLENKTSQAILAQIQEVRQQVVAENFIPKAPLSAQIQKLSMVAHHKAYSYYRSIYDRWKKLLQLRSEQQKQLEQTAATPTEKVHYLTTQVQIVRLQTLLDKIQIYMDQSADNAQYSIL